ncbi:MAG: NUDIX hydrolase [Candidatus Aenigmarchaeota archaeon]|nr:NUDIX hydrolase [Candidatus Aenigmarchaeota archaeon]
MKRKYRRYVFAVAFLRRKEPQFLLLHRTKNWKGWELPKGGFQDCEKASVCLNRELREETGQKKIKIIAKTRHFIKYPFPKGFLKDGHIYHGAKGYVFVVELFSKKVKVDKNEHDKYMWLGMNEAMEILTHKNQKNALKYVCDRYKLS